LVFAKTSERDRHQRCSCSLQYDPLPPLNGGRVAVGLLPNVFALPLARLERYGMLVIIGLLFVAPVVGANFGIDLNLLGWLISGPAHALVETIIGLTGNA
jgi:hypothetical protein